VLHAGFEFVDAGDIDFGASANRGGGILRDLACFGERVGRRKLDFQPLGELVRVTPNLAHLLAGVTWDQFFLLKRTAKSVGVYLPAPHSMIPQLENGSLDGYARRSVRNWDGQWRKRAANNRGDEEGGA